ncbi:beta-lactamase regulator AmpE [Thalassotalea sp. PLHSN55]|uniref:beta-lactamase regulator AmpE n=1 Tax=Thalassotalea sp. PLHSN55 TaxID=3435888 RepID=UPI003F853FB8
MSLISLLIALAAERHLSSPLWQFSTFYQNYLRAFIKVKALASPWQSSSITALFVIAPVIVVYIILDLVDDSLLHLIISTLILIVCFGCFKTRDCYKNYLMSAFRGEITTCEMHHLQLQQDKDQPEMGFGQLLVWLNFRYFIAIMIFFVVFGAAGALFYRLLTTVAEQNTLEDLPIDEDVNNQAKQWLAWVDWPLVRIVAFGYMLVGHFSKALPVWLESIFDFEKAPHRILSNVAQKSEDFMMDDEDCTAEPCLLVKLAKRTLLLCLAVIALLILTGVLS